MTPYTIAIKEGHTLIADYLLSRDANPKFRLHYLAYIGAVSEIKTMLFATSLENLQDDFGRSALAWATMGKQPESIRLLLEARTDVHLR